ncbi:MAG: hypothetical protein ACERKZ_19400 [Lachnotalea sp.]
MSNKSINKLIAFTAITGAAIAAGIAYFKHKKDSDLFDDEFADLDDDFDDEDFDFPLPEEKDESATKREYVSLNLDKSSASVEENIDEEVASVEESNSEDIKSSDSTTPNEQDTATDAEDSEEIKTV